MEGKLTVIMRKVLGGRFDSNDGETELDGAVFLERERTCRPRERETPRDEGERAQK